MTPMASAEAWAFSSEKRWKSAADTVAEDGSLTIRVLWINLTGQLLIDAAVLCSFAGALAVGRVVEPAANCEVQGKVVCMTDAIATRKEEACGHS